MRNARANRDRILLPPIFRSAREQARQQPGYAVALIYGFTRALEQEGMLYPCYVAPGLLTLNDSAICIKREGWTGCFSLSMDVRRVWRITGVQCCNRRHPAGYAYETLAAVLRSYPRLRSIFCDAAPPDLSALPCHSYYCDE